MADTPNEAVAVATPDDGKPLTATVRREHAKRVARLTVSFITAGQDLAWIRDHKSYRGTHATFEAFCRDTWEFSPDYSRKLIRSSEVMDTLQTADTNTIVSVLPQNEAQTRPLTTVDLDEVGDVWQEVVEKAPKDDDGAPVITAKHVEETVDSWKAADGPAVEPAEDDAPTCPDCGGDTDIEGDCMECYEAPKDDKEPAADPSGLTVAREMIFKHASKQDGGSAAVAAILRGWADELDAIDH